MRCGDSSTFDTTGSTQQEGSGKAETGYDSRLQDPAGLSTWADRNQARRIKIYLRPEVLQTRQREFVKAVNRRAGELMGEYRDKAANMDRLLGEEG